jgi:hypothetical protein
MSKQPATAPRPVRSTSAAAARTAARPGAARKVVKPGAAKPFNMPFERKNVLVIIAGVLVIALGYFIMWASPTMSAMALTVAPIVLLIGYLIVVPMGILAGTRTFRKPANEPPAAA